MQPGRHLPLQSIQNFRKRSPAGAPPCWGRYLLYATNAESYFGLCDFVCLPARMAGGRRRRFEGGEECAFGEAARAGICSAGDHYARAHSVARTLLVARSVGGARDGAARRRDCGGIYRHAVCGIWTEAGGRSRDRVASSSSNIGLERSAIRVEGRSPTSTC